jgi:hypothetical protein
MNSPYSNQFTVYVYSTSGARDRMKLKLYVEFSLNFINLLPPNDIYTYIYRTAPLTSRRCVLKTYSTNIHKEYFKQNAVYFIILPRLVPVLLTF